MKNLQIINQNGQLLVDSREVADMTGKSHAHLMRDIQVYKKILDENPKLDSQNFFIPSTYKTNGNNKTYDCYLLTRKGCDMVANKMTGEKGVLFTATYVTQFEKMEQQLKQPFKLPSTYKEALLMLIEKEEEREQLHTENLMLGQRVAEYEPKITYLDQILSSTDSVTITQIAADYGMSAQKFNKILHESGIQYKINGQWILYTKYKSEGYTKSKTTDVLRSDGTTKVVMNTQWTQKGRLFIYNILKAKEIYPVMDIQVDKQLKLVSGSKR
ncbi:phage antirepressor KilAC domain-containing protein [Cytobacillus sp. FSL R7-0680]|uniref:phage antirepressor KilAC domain-containing protein n=1 Tax=Cytobacillus sp. FSL R7-0680 TaxID=2921689 RepID=UPI0030F5770E